MSCERATASKTALLYESMSNRKDIFCFVFFGGGGFLCRNMTMTVQLLNYTLKYQH